MNAELRLLMLAATPVLVMSSCSSAPKEDAQLDLVEGIRSGTYIGIRQETTARGTDTYPAVSPDGRELAYQRYQDDNYDLWIKPCLTMSDSPGRQVTVDRSDDRRAAWLGTDQIVFDSTRLEDSKVWRKNATGRGAPTLLSRRQSADMDAHASPDGSVVYVSIVSEPAFLAADDKGKLWRLFRDMPTIWRADPDGSISILGRGLAPCWSPDGTKIAYASNEAGNWDIYVIDRDGSNRTPVVATPADEIEPCWWLAFVSNRSSARDGDDYNLWVTRSDGSSPKQITSSSGYEGGPSWGSDPQNAGGRIYFHAYQNQDWDIWSLAPVLD